MRLTGGARLSVEEKREETRGATGNWAACLLGRAEGKERANAAAGLQAGEAGRAVGLGRRGEAGQQAESKGGERNSFSIF